SSLLSSSADFIQNLPQPRHGDWRLAEAEHVIEASEFPDGGTETRPQQRLSEFPGGLRGRLSIAFLAQGFQQPLISHSGLARAQRELPASKLPSPKKADFSQRPGPPGWSPSTRA